MYLCANNSATEDDDELVAALRFGAAAGGVPANFLESYQPQLDFWSVLIAGGLENCARKVDTDKKKNQNEADGIEGKLCSPNIAADAEAIPGGARGGVATSTSCFSFEREPLK